MIPQLSHTDPVRLFNTVLLSKICSLVEKNSWLKKVPGVLLFFPSNGTIHGINRRRYYRFSVPEPGMGYLMCGKCVNFHKYHIKSLCNV